MQQHNGNQRDFKDKIEGYQIIFYMAMQFILGIAVIVAFFMVLNKLIDAKTTFDAAKYGSVEALLAGTVYKAFWYFFPNPSAENNTKKKAVKKLTNRSSSLPPTPEP